MRQPPEPVTLSAEQVRELKQKLIDLRHEVNNAAALMLAAVVFEILEIRLSIRSLEIELADIQPLDATLRLPPG